MKATCMGLGMGAALCLAACGDASRPVAEGSGEPSAGRVADAAATVAASTPYARAERALAEGRMLAPAGDNAIEHYLDARAQKSERVRAQAALAELQPYVLIAAEQAIARSDGREAARLQVLIARIDPGAPALPRLRAGLDGLVREQEARDAEAVASATPLPVGRSPTTGMERTFTVNLAPEPATPSARAPEPSAAPAEVVMQDTHPSPSIEAPVPSPTVEPARAPRLVQDAQPRYPLPALRARIEGEARVAFTIQPDGSVRNARLLSSTPPGMFEASALAVAQRWRFEATGRVHDSSRTVRFRLPAEAARDG